MKNPASLLPWSIKPAYQRGKFFFFDAKGDHIFTVRGKNMLSDVECIINSVNMKPALIEIILMQFKVIEAMKNGETHIDTTQYGKQEIDKLIPWLEEKFEKTVKAGEEF